MRITNVLSTAAPPRGAWRYANEAGIKITDDVGNSWVILPCDGGLQIMEADGLDLVVRPRSANTIELKGEL